MQNVSVSFSSLTVVSCETPHWSIQLISLSDGTCPHQLLSLAFTPNLLNFDPKALDPFDKTTELKNVNQSQWTSSRVGMFTTNAVADHHVAHETYTHREVHNVQHFRLKCTKEAEGNLSHISAQFLWRDTSFWTRNPFVCLTARYTVPLLTAN